MSLVCIFCGWACAACIVGLQAGSKNKNKVRRAVDNGSWDRLKKNRPKSGLNDPELIEQKLSKTWILSFGPKSHSRNVPPEICLFFFRPKSRVWGTFRPKSASRTFCTPRDRLNPTSTPGFRLLFFFFVRTRGARFVHRRSARIPFSPQLWTYHQYQMFTTTLKLHFITRAQDLKLEIYDNNLVNTYDHSAAYCTLRRGA